MARQRQSTRRSYVPWVLLYLCFFGAMGFVCFRSDDLGPTYDAERASEALKARNFTKITPERFMFETSWRRACPIESLEKGWSCTKVSFHDEDDRLQYGVVSCPPTGACKVLMEVRAP